MSSKFKTPEEVIKHARERGANISHTHDNMVKIKTERGSMFVNPRQKEFDKQTQSTISRWMKLLGLLAILIFIVWPFVIKPVLYWMGIMI